MRIAVIGATGAVGQELVAALAEVADEELLKLEPPVLLATNRSAGEEFPWVEEEDLVVEEFSAENVRGLDAAIVAVPPAQAAAVIAVLRQQGVVALDLSRTHRRDAPLFFQPSMPLASVPVVALPSAEALELARVVQALLPLAPAWVRTSVLKAASGAGQAGVNELADATGKLLNGQEPETATLPHRLAFNAVPQAGPFLGETAEAEADLAFEVPKLLGRPLPVASTVVWMPWFYSHLQLVTVGFEGAVSAAEVRTRLGQAPGLKLLDDPAQGIYPMPSLATGDDAVLVGRVRADPTDPRAVQLVAAMDNARSAAAHAVEALRALARARAAH